MTFEEIVPEFVSDCRFSFTCRNEVVEAHSYSFTCRNSLTSRMTERYLGSDQEIAVAVNDNWALELGR
jgi:hypothetical protein